MSSFRSFFWAVALTASTCALAQDTSTQPASPAQPGSPSTQAPAPAAAATPGNAQPSTTSSSIASVSNKPPVEPAVIEDGGFSFEPFYWFTSAQPRLRGGRNTSAYSILDYPGKSHFSYGGEIAMPAGKQNTLRLTYFRNQGIGNLTETQSVNLFSEGYSPGDYLTTEHTLQSFKLSWDYLGYTWYRKSSKIRLKTLYEVQYTNITTTIAAPLKPVTTDSSTDTTDDNIASGTKNAILPTFGLELEEAVNKHFRWEVKATGFGIPKRSDIWDAEGSLICRVRNWELFVGEKAYHFKTTPRSDFYFTDTLSGAFVGLRWYWGNE